MSETATRSPIEDLGQTEPNRKQAKRYIAERYEVVNTLEGGMGLVYLCRDHFTSELVALKTFKPEYLSHRAARDLFLREGTMWVEIGRHPNVVQAYRVERVGDGREVYLVLEWIVQPQDKKTPSLRSWLKKGSPLPVEESILFALHVARGMRFATQKIPGLVHRDLKPENILIGYDHVARVTDFGLASTLSGHSPGSTVGSLENSRENIGRTQLTQGVAGTPLYMAPEQWQHQGLDARADIYALGCILYEMVTGRFAAQGESREDLREIHLNGRIPPLDAALPLPLRDFINRVLSIPREQRYRDWAEAEKALAAVYTQVTGEPSPPEWDGAEETPDERRAAGNSYNTMGLSYLDIGKLDVAVMYFEQAVNVARAENIRELEGKGLGNLGLAYAALGYTERAIEFHEEHLAIARELGDRAEQGRSQGNLGLVYRQKGEPERAVRFHEKELQIFQRLANRFKEAEALHNLGETYRQLGDAVRAEDYYKQSLAIARDIGDRTRLERILNSMGKVFLDSGEFKEAAQLFKQTLTISRQIGDRVGEGEVLSNLAELYFASGHIDRAIEYYGYALTIAHESNDRRKTIKNVLRLGDLYLRNGDIDEALAHYENGLISAQEITDQVQELTAFGKLGEAFDVQGNYTESGRMYKRGLLLARERNNREVEQLMLQKLAKAYELWGDFSRAVTYLEQSLAMVEADENVLAQILHWGELAQLFRKLNQPRPAEEAYEKRLELAQSLNEHGVVAETLSDLGDLSRVMGAHSEAMDFYKDALELAEEHGLALQEAAALSGMGMSFFETGKKRQAVRELERSLEAAKKSRSSRVVANVSYRLALVMCKQARWDKAEPHAKLAFKLYGRINDTTMQDRSEAMLRRIKNNKGKSTGFFQNLLES
ncbi:tetratricopeptide repeat protein [Candidatus Leptofilum sp.]|uniref:tetratricopeptide repeat protein n=1 Tax=Candidatus Leptofilum sp. TaxID=3241576 RepID=UPI003B5939D3